MTTNTTALVEALTKTKDQGETVRARETELAALRCFVEVATPRVIRLLGGDLAKAQYVVTWRSPEVPSGRLWTLTFDGGANGGTYVLKVPRYDQIGSYYTGTLDRLS